MPIIHLIEKIRERRSSDRGRVGSPAGRETLGAAAAAAAAKPREDDEEGQCARDRPKSHRKSQRPSNPMGG
jgi:hypothetical protein